MKNRIVLMFLVALSLAVVSAPLSADTGIRAGYMNSTIRKGGEGFFENNYESFYLGTLGDTKIIPLLYFGYGLEYYQTGSKLDDNNKLVLHYISLPLSLKVKFGPIQAFGGFHGAVKVSGSLTTLGQSTSAQGFETFDAGAFVGLGAKIAFIGAEARYTWGLIDIKDGYKNNYFQAGLTLWF